MICPNCGREIPTSEICVYCGNKTEFTQRTIHLSVGNAHNVCNINTYKKNRCRQMIVLIVISLVTGLLLGSSVMYLIGSNIIWNQTIATPTDPDTECIYQIGETEASIVYTPIKISFDLNPSTEMEQYMHGIYPPPAMELSRELPYVREIDEWILVGWNTNPAGTGKSFVWGEVFSEKITEDIILYAQWMKVDSICHDEAKIPPTAEETDENVLAQGSDSEASTASTDVEVYSPTT